MPVPPCIRIALGVKMDTQAANLLLLRVQIASLLVAIVTLIALIVYVWKTWEMAAATRAAAIAAEKTVAEMRASREGEWRPYVLLQFFLRPNSSAVYLSVRNVGKSAARNVRMVFDKPLVTSRSSVISDQSMFVNGIAVLPPGAELITFFDVAFAIFQPQQPYRTWTVEMEYAADQSTEPYHETQILDLECFRGTSLSQEKGAGDIVKELSNATSELKTLSRSMRTLTETLTDTLPQCASDGLSSDLFEEGFPVSRVLSELQHLTRVWSLYVEDQEADRGSYFWSFVEKEMPSIANRLLWLSACSAELGPEIASRVSDIARALQDAADTSLPMDGGVSLANLKADITAQSVAAEEVAQELAARP